MLIVVVAMNKSILSMNSYLEKLFCLKGNVAIVTDISGEVGAMISEGLALSGAKTYSLGSCSSSPWQLLDNEYYVRCNISNISAFQLLCQKIYQQHGRLTTLVNLANIVITSESISEQRSKQIDIQQALKVNLQDVLNTSKTVAQFMKKSGGGSIINIISINAKANFINSYSYMNIKNSLTIITKRLAVELIKDNVRINNLVLGYTQNKINHSEYVNQKRNQRLEELIGTTIFFASKNSLNFTGQSIFHFLLQ